MNHPLEEVGPPEGLPDFVDPTDVVDASFEASTTWGTDRPARDSFAGPGQTPSASTRSSTVAADRAGRQRTRERATRGSRKKRTLTWAEKEERRQKRAEKRRVEDEAAREKDPVGHAREIVLTQLTAAPRSRAQLAEKLRSREVSEGVIEAVLDRMEDVGLVDDAAYAGMLVRSQLASRGLARRALAQELQRKGIEPEVAEEALAQVDDEAERERALELARKKMAAMSRLDEQTRTRRLAGMLARKGYPPPLVWSVVKELQGSFDPENPL